MNYCVYFKPEGFNEVANYIQPRFKNELRGYFLDKDYIRRWNPVSKQIGELYVRVIKQLLNAIKELDGVDIHGTIVMGEVHCGEMVNVVVEEKV